MCFGGQTAFLPSTATDRVKLAATEVCDKETVTFEKLHHGACPASQLWKMAEAVHNPWLARAKIPIPAQSDPS